MRFSILLGAGRHCIDFNSETAVALDETFNAASHHYWMMRQFYRSNFQYDFHEILKNEHSQSLIKLILKCDFKNAKDPFNSGFDMPAVWAHSELSPILNGEIFCNMSCDARYLPGVHHPADLILTIAPPIDLLLKAS